MRLRLLLLTVLCALWATPAWSQDSSDTLPACAPGDDYDGDGVPNLEDSDETDSCQLDPRGTGLVDCTTGAGDGFPDCRPE